MPADDPILKTSFRIPRSVHAEVERAAEQAGLTVNGEVVYRLKHDPRDESGRAILAHIEARDTAIVDGLKKQIAALWGALDRANATLEQVAVAMSQVKPGTDAAELKKEVDFARELIAAMRAHR
jgi:hypothetical protein